MLDVTLIQLFHPKSELLFPEGVLVVFVAAEVVVEVADGAVAEDVFEVLEEVGCMLIASVPGFLGMLVRVGGDWGLG